MANKILYGIKNVHYSTWDDTATTPGWKTPVAVPGAVKLALKTTGDTNKFYADNKTYATFEVGGGYEGNLDVALLADDSFTELLGFVKDSIGGLVEISNFKPKPFCLLFEVEGDEKAKRFAFYNVTASRPEMNANTTTDKTEPDTMSLPVVCSSRTITSGTGTTAITKDVTKISVERDSTSATAYDAWFTSVYMPTFTA